MRVPALLVIASALVSCTMAPPPPGYAAAQAAQEQAAFQKALAGRVPAGRPVACLPHYATNDTVNLSENTILFRQGGTTYVNHPPGGCPGLNNGFYVLVTRSVGGQLCRGDIANVADISNHMIVGTCTMGDFIPYRRPGA
jgi:hypothetical protein